ncbi:MAG: anthranilate phosphoribosyltransferase [Nitrospinota bacterium]|nr:anthranilate phosphoribosyltransferase [Nitrospinota bacterium]MDH5757212.1 anthranilate phosphoribosyltransferase [Nitrospinota bacterium]
MIKEAIGKLVWCQNLEEAEMVQVMEEIMTGGASEAQIGSFLTALRLKGETVDEISGAARVMREKSVKIIPGPEPVVDTCGTGGDDSGTFNISTTSAFVTSGAGITVAKHGNKAVSSKSGSADVLAALGVNIQAEVSRVEECLAQVGIGFLFAPLMHGAMKYAIGPRREIGIRTVFNILGPLTNPAGAKAQVVGVYSDALVEPIARVLGRLGSRHVMVVHGSDGLDEITITGHTTVSSFNNGIVENFTIQPEDYGLYPRSIDEIKGGDAVQNAAILRDVLSGKKGAPRDVVLLNAAAAIMVSGKATTMHDGILMATESIDSGAAQAKLDKLVEFCGA